jgi:hypothetical protein
MSNLVRQTGPMKSIKVLADELTPGDSPKLRIDMSVECEKKTIKAMARFQFVGLRGHIVGFDVPVD